MDFLGIFLLHETFNLNASEFSDGVASLGEGKIRKNCYHAKSKGCPKVNLYLWEW